MKIKALVSEYYGDFEKQSTDVILYKKDPIGTYYYDETTASFSTTGAGYTYSPVTVSINKDTKLSDVQAKISTAFVYNALNVKEWLLRIYMQFKPFKGQFTVKQSVLAQFNELDGGITRDGYQAPQEVNEDVTEGRVEGTRAFIIENLQVASRVTDTISITVEGTNELELFDIVYQIAQPQMREDSNVG